MINITVKMVNKGIKVRIYPNQNQEKQFRVNFGACRFVYNNILERTFIFKLFRLCRHSDIIIDLSDNKKRDHLGKNGFLKPDSICINNFFTFRHSDD